MNAALTIKALRHNDPAVLAGLETPCYLFDPHTVIEDLRELRRQLGTPVVVSVKASPVLDLLVRCNQEFIDGIEIASMGELNLTIGRMSVPRFVNTPAMDETLIAAALACKATLVVDNPYQLKLVESALQTQAARGRASPGIVLRVNAASLLDRSGPATDHFGMDLPTLHGELARLSKNEAGPKVIGLHVFAGSHSFANSSLDIVHSLIRLVGEVRSYAAAKLDLVLIGTGLVADWRERGIDFAAYRNSLRDLQGQIRVMHEAGRAIFSRSGTFATRVIAVKELNGDPVVICDGGMAHCFSLAQTEQFVKHWREPRLIKARTSSAAGDAPMRAYTVVGNSCNRADVIGRMQSAEIPASGDMLLFEHCGAYHSYSPTSFLNLRPARRYIAS